MKKFDTGAYITLIRNAFESYANPAIAARQSAYMKNLFPFFGIKTPERNAIVSAFLAEHGTPPFKQLEKVLRLCYKQKEREFHLFAIHLASKFVATHPIEIIPMLEYLITTNSWWDSVDSVSGACLRPLFKLKPGLLDKQTLQWVNSGNLWLQRSAIICQLLYKDKTNEEVLFRNIKALKDTNEFFLNKAIGWALREYSKTRPRRVKDFIKANKLSPLSVREGSKYL